MCYDFIKNKKNNKIAPVITIDGPSASGKSTLCALIAKVLKWNFLDSGAIYRILAIESLHYHVNFFSEEELMLLIANLNIRFMYSNKNLKVILRDKDVSRKIYIQKVAHIASKIALYPHVREALLYFQRKFRIFPGLIANGRDMGTTVFPDALLKIFLDASPEERANRRMLQLKKNGFNANFQDLLSEIKKRDECDQNRSISPLIPAKDALVIDTTNLTSKQLIKKIYNILWKNCIV